MRRQHGLLRRMRIARGTRRRPFGRGRMCAVRRQRRALRLLFDILTRVFSTRGTGRANVTRQHAVALVISDHGRVWMRMRRMRHVMGVCGRIGRPSGVPIATGREWGRSGTRRWVLSVSAPLWAGRTAQGVRLVRLRVHILRQGDASLVGKAIGGLALEQGQTGFDVGVVGVEIGGASVGVEGVAGLVVAGFVLAGASAMAAWW